MVITLSKIPKAKSDGDWKEMQAPLKIGGKSVGCALALFVKLEWITHHTYAIAAFKENYIKIDSIFCLFFVMALFSQSRRWLSRPQ